MRTINGGTPRKMVKAVRDDSSLEVDCPVCDAKRKERCHIQPGVVRFESHLDRMEYANERKVQALDLDEVLYILAERQHPGKGEDS
jgi:hypothetical protein